MLHEDAAGRVCVAELEGRIDLGDRRIPRELPVVDHSGDLAQIDALGYITIVDRKKDVIKTGGVMVASREVEDAVFTHPAVQEVAVIATPDPKWIDAVTAVVERKPGASVLADELTEHTRARLAPFKVPKRFVFVDALPKNASGKILKRVLKDKLGAE